MNSAQQITNDCPYCRRSMRPSELTCGHCQVSVRGDFPAMPLAGLPTEHQRFIEMFVLASGNLKEIATHAGVSYPTVRSRLDKVIGALREIIADAEADERASSAISDEPTAAEIIKRI